MHLHEPRGYFNNEEATRETYVGEWLRTGDIMRVDENDNFWVTDRLKEVCINTAKTENSADLFSL